MSQHTISRLETTPSAKALVWMGSVMADREISQLAPGTRRVIIDVDPTDDLCHGQQEFKFFNGHYGEHCYLPLHFHITGDDGSSGFSAACFGLVTRAQPKGLKSALRIAIRLLRGYLPDVEIILRAVILSMRPAVGDVSSVWSRR